MNNNDGVESPVDRSHLIAIRRRIGECAREGDLEAVRSLMDQFLAVGNIHDPVHAKSKDTLLHMALSRNKPDVVDYLLNCCQQQGELTVRLTLNAPNSQGVTPLMVAVVASRNVFLLRRLLRLGADPFTRNFKARKTALDLAREINYREAVELLEHTMETLSANNDSIETVMGAPKDPPITRQPSATTITPLHCPFCGEKLKRKTRLDHAMEGYNRSAAGKENPYLVEFFDSPLCRVIASEPSYHVLTSKRHLRKEITESWSIIHHLEQMNVTANTTMQLIDLCAGNSLTTTVFGLRHPCSTAIAIDRMAPSSVPHFTGNLAYLRADIMDASFGALLQTKLNSKEDFPVLVGMHLCGELSLRAVQLFSEIQSIRAIILSPCCFPKHGATDANRKQTRNAKNKQRENTECDKPSYEELIRQLQSLSSEVAKYECWSQYLCNQVRQFCDETTLVVERDKNILSTRNMIIVGSR